MKGLMAALALTAALAVPATADTRYQTLVAEGPCEGCRFGNFTFDFGDGHLVLYGGVKLTPEFGVWRVENGYLDVYDRRTHEIIVRSEDVTAFVFTVPFEFSPIYRCVAPAHLEDFVGFVYGSGTDAISGKPLVFSTYEHKLTKPDPCDQPGPVWNETGIEVIVLDEPTSTLRSSASSSKSPESWGKIKASYR